MSNKTKTVSVEVPEFAGYRFVGWQQANPGQHWINHRGELEERCRTIKTDGTYMVYEKIEPIVRYCNIYSDGSTGQCWDTAKKAREVQKEFANGRVIQFVQNLEYTDE